jgi:hypothetical protein
MHRKRLQDTRYAPDPPEGEKRTIRHSDSVSSLEMVALEGQGKDALDDPQSCFNMQAIVPVRAFSRARSFQLSPPTKVREFRLVSQALFGIGKPFTNRTPEQGDGRWVKSEPLSPLREARKQDGSPMNLTEVSGTEATAKALVSQLESSPRGAD